MAPRFPGRRRGRAAPAPADQAPEPEADDEPVHLDDDEHAWWAQRDVATAWAPPAPPPGGEDAEPERDVLAEHFGADWRTTFGYPSDTVPPPPAAEPPVEDTADPYAVLEVDPSSTWEAIVDAHRSMARRHHPDRLVGRSEAEVAAGEASIRAINAAYAELKVRRGR